MKQYNGAKAEKTTNEKLPAGGYVVQIMGAEVETLDWGEKLRLDFEIYEGKYAGFFAAQYRASTFDDKKWKGCFRLIVPSEGSQYFESEKRRFNNFIYAIEASNPNYHWDWNEKGLKGKFLGVVYGEKEWEYKDKTGWATVCAALYSADDIRQGNYKVPEPKALQKAAEKASEPFQTVSDDDLPF